MDMTNGQMAKMIVEIKSFRIIGQIYGGWGQSKFEVQNVVSQIMTCLNVM